MVSELGWGSWDRNEWAKKNGISPYTADKDKVWIEERLEAPMEVFERISPDLIRGMAEICDNARKNALTTDSERHRVAFSRLFMEGCEKITTLFERYGLKEVTASAVVDVRHSSMVESIVRQVFEIEADTKPAEKEERVIEHKTEA